MFQVWFHGTQYAIGPMEKLLPGWSVIDSAGTLEEACAKSKKDWDHFWDLCGFVPSFPISVIYS